MAWSNKLYKKFKIKKEVNICLVKIVIYTYMVYLERIFKWKTKAALKCRTVLLENMGKAFGRV